ncbi:MAG: PEP-CTERM system TPR-repeat protein PrsT [Gammaproteobacteria bacterium]|nr:PEP-CTERM system TPR-repeat protein PrsT [Gammaproteobacteria bacterium]
MTCAAIVILAMVACGGGTAEERLERAVGYEASGRNQAAILELRGALQQDPELTAARMLLGQLFLEVGQASAAVVELERAGRLGEASEAHAVALARARVASGETRHLRKVVDSLSQTEPKALSTALAAALGRAQLALGETAKARELLANLAEREPAAAEAWLGLARLEMAEGDVQLALRHAEEAMRLDPDVLETAMTAGELRLASGDPAGARKAFDQAIAIASGREASTAAARLGLVRALMTLEEFAEARPILTQVLREAPNYAEANYLEAWFHLQDNAFTEAKPHLERVLQVMPDHQDSRYLLAVVAFREGRYDQARDALQRLVARHPADRRARLLLAQVYGQQGAHRDAVRVLRAGLDAPLAAQPHAALPGAPQPDAAYKLALGQSLMRAGNHKEGVETLAQAAAEAPEAADIGTQFALAQLATGASRAAETELIRVTEHGSNSAAPEMFLILMQIEARRFDEAVASAKRFAARHADAPTAHNVLGAAHLANGDEPAARQAMRQALALDPSFAPAAVNLALLEAQAGDMATARSLLNGVLAAEPGHRSATIAMADLAYAEGDIETTQRFVGNAWQADPSDVDLSLRLAALHMRQDEPERALEVLAGLGNNADVSDAVLTARVRAGRQAGHLEAPVAALETLLRRHPDDQQLLLALAQTLAGGHETERAQQVLQDRIRDPDAAQTPLLILQAELLLHHQSLARAEEVISLLSRRQDAGAAMPLLRGDLAFRRGSAESATLHYVEAHGLQPTQTTLRRLQAARAATGSPEQGRSDLMAWVAEHPDDSQVRNMLAELHLSLGELKQAIEHYETLVSQAPENPVLLNNLAWLYGKTGHTDAVATARRAHRLAPDVASVQDTLGWLLLQQGDVTSALELLQRAAAASPESPEIQYHLAVALKLSGERSEARRLLQPLLDAKFDYSNDARELFEQLGSL